MGKVDFNKLAGLILTGGVALGQASSLVPVSQNAVPIVKPTPASDSLTEAAKDLAANQTNFNNVLNQARSTADTSSKQLQEQMIAKSKELMDKIRADKKFGPALVELETLQKQINNLQQDQQDKFQKESGPIQRKIGEDNALIQGLIPIVKKENGFDDSTTFDINTQTWKANPAPKKEGK